MYRGNDIWQIAETTVTGKEEYIKPYYSMVKNNTFNGMALPSIYAMDEEGENMAVLLCRGHGRLRVTAVEGEAIHVICMPVRA